MQVQNKNVTFTGYGARLLRGVFLRSTDLYPCKFRKITSQLEKIGQKHGFDVFVQTNNGIYFKDLGRLPEDEYLRSYAQYTWCQDNITFTPDSFISNSDVIFALNYKIQKLFGLKGLDTKRHIAGGNYFVVDDNGKKELLLGQYHIGNLGALVENLGINSVKLLPQADFHLDLFIRPLKNKTVLVADDRMWFERINGIIRNIEHEPSLTNVRNKLIKIRRKIFNMASELPNTSYAHLSKVQNALTEAGYNVVKVPGRIFKYVKDKDGKLPQHVLNYINAIVHVNKEGELVYITNKSALNRYCGISKNVANKIGFDFETEFVNSVKDYIKPENIYFVDTYKFLKYFQGGIHCLSAEMPKF